MSASRPDGSGNINFDVPFVKGQVKVPAAMLHNGDFDIDGVKLMPGSKVTGFSVFAQDKGTKVDMAFTATAPPDQVRSYFLDQFNAKGVEAALSGDAVSGKSKDGDPFVIHVSPSGQRLSRTSGDPGQGLSLARASSERAGIAPGPSVP